MNQRFFKVVALAALSACGSETKQHSQKAPENVPQAAIIRMEVDNNGYLVGEPALRAVSTDGVVRSVGGVLLEGEGGGVAPVPTYISNSFKLISGIEKGTKRRQKNFGVNCVSYETK